jgi:hypothetical protein
MIVALAPMFAFAGTISDVMPQDSVRIVSVTPDAFYSIDEPATFTVVADYTLASVDQGVVYLGFNTSEVNSYSLFDEEIVSRGSGTCTLTATVTPVNWGASGSLADEVRRGINSLFGLSSGDQAFGAYVNISAYPHPDSWNPLSFSVFDLENRVGERAEEEQGYVFGRDDYKFLNFGGNFQTDHILPIYNFNVMSPVWASFFSLKALDPGRCYGMAATNMLFYNGLLEQGNFQDGANHTYEFQPPAEISGYSKLAELIDTYHVAQFIPEILIMNNVLNKNNFEGLADELQSGNCVLLTIESSSGFHTVFAYRIQDSDRAGYRYKASIYDPNRRDGDGAVYFDSKSRKWIYCAWNESEWTEGDITIIRTVDLCFYLNRAILTNSRRFDLAPVTSTIFGGVSASADEDAETLAKTYMVLRADRTVASISSGGKRIEQVEGVFEVPIYSSVSAGTGIPDPEESSRYFMAPYGVYQVKARPDAGANCAAFFDGEVGFSVTTDDVNAAVEGIAGTEGYTRILSEKENSFELIYMTNEIAEDPIIVSGVSEGEIAFTAAGEAAGDGVVISGASDIVVRNEESIRSVRLDSGDEVLVSMADPGEPLTATYIKGGPERQDDEATGLIDPEKDDLGSETQTSGIGSLLAVIVCLAIAVSVSVAALVRRKTGKDLFNTARIGNGYTGRDDGKAAGMIGPGHIRKNAESSNTSSTFGPGKVFKKKR